MADDRQIPSARAAAAMPITALSTAAPPLQIIVLELLQFWTASRGPAATLLPACDLPIGHGLLHPLCFARLFDDAPWRAVVLQPLRRPRDARYGRLTHRAGRHQQVVAVRKGPGPAPFDGVRALLAHLGVEPADHDLRFTEDRFHLPALALETFGWRVRLDGIGLGRVDWVQRAAGVELATPALVIALGVERLGICLQGVDGVDELAWSADQRYADLRRAEERMLSAYAFEIVDGAELRRRLEDLDRDAVRCLDATLPLPAFEAAVRSLHVLELLAARDALDDDQQRLWTERIRQRVVAVGAQLRDAAGDDGNGDEARDDGA